MSRPDMKAGLREKLRLYAVTDRRWLNGAALASRVRSVLKGGVTILQLREKGMAREELLREAVEIAEICREYNVPLLINDDVEVARQVGAGVHLGQSDVACCEARKLLGPEAIIGVTCRSVEHAAAAYEAGADYIGVGAAFATGTKLDTELLGPDGVADIVRSVPLPAVAIGGITMENAPLLAKSGVAGVAVVSALFAAEDPEKAAAEMLATVRRFENQ